MTTVTTIPFSRLVAVDGINARQAGGKYVMREAPWTSASQ